MQTLTLSAHRLDLAACPRRLWYYQHALGGRAPALARAALVQGVAGHGALALWRKGEPQEKQDAYVQRVFDAHTLPEDDYRKPSYFSEALAQYRAEHREPEQFDIEEVEEEFKLPLGIVCILKHYDEWQILWTGRRDMVGVSKMDGKRYMISNKFVSQNRQADVKALANSRAEKSYWWAWEQQHPDKPLAGIIPRRCVIRAPRKDGKLNIELPIDDVIRFDPWQIQEWVTDTLQFAKAILSRDPNILSDWPMETALCKGPYGCCDYMDVCMLPPEDRLLKLGNDTFKPSDERPAWEELET